MALIDIIEKQLADTQRKISDLDDAYHHSCCQFEEKFEQAYHKEYYALSAQEEEYRANYIRQRSEHELTFEELQREKKRELMK